MNFKNENPTQMESELEWIVLWRLFIMILIPLIPAIFVNNIFLKIILWVISFFIFYYSVKIWGQIVFSLAIIIILIYLVFEISNLPNWYFYLASGIVIFQIFYMKSYLQKIRGT